MRSRAPTRSQNASSISCSALRCSPLWSKHSSCESKVDAARASQQQLARLAPDALGSRYVAARVAMAGNDYAAAVSELRKIIEVAPRLQQARLLLAMALIAQGNLEQAGRELSTLVEQEPDNVVARQLLAQVRMRLDDPDGALRLLVPALGAGGDER